LDGTKEVVERGGELQFVNPAYTSQTCPNARLWMPPAIEAGRSLFARLVATQATPTLLAHGT
jgi:hypothetical protein